MAEVYPLGRNKTYYSAAGLAGLDELALSAPKL